MTANQFTDSDNMVNQGVSEMDTVTEYEDRIARLERGLHEQWEENMSYMGALMIVYSWLKGQQSDLSTDDMIAMIAKELGLQQNLEMEL